MRDLPGFGDEATWPPFSGHPNDPRHPGYDDEDGFDGMTIADVIDYLKQFDMDTRVVLFADSIPNKHNCPDHVSYIALETLPLEE
jgi:hypothetical protein